MPRDAEDGGTDVEMGVEASESLLLLLRPVSSLLTTPLPWTAAAAAVRGGLAGWPPLLLPLLRGCEPRNAPVDSGGKAGCGCGDRDCAECSGCGWALLDCALGTEGA